jgi:glycosyltransferase involved in cell wall biosynthesis
MNIQKKRRLSIVHTEASNGLGGQDLRVLHEAFWFHDQGHRVHIFNPRQGQIFKRACSLGMGCTAVPFTKSGQAFDFIRLVRSLRSIRPDLVCTHSSVDSWVGLLAARYCRVPVAIRYRHVSTPIRGHWANRLQYRGLCDHVITTAELIQKSIQDGFSLPADRISSIPTGINAPPLVSRATARADLLRRFDLPADAVLIGQVSALRSWKGQYVLINAFEQLAAKMPKSYLLLVGGGPVMADYAKRGRESPFSQRILLPGHQDDVWPFFRGMDVAVLSSTKNEGIPQVGLQAMFAGCPFVGTTVGGIPEIVHHEQTGLLVPPNDPLVLSAAISRILDQPDLAKELTYNARARVHNRFTLDAMGQTLESLFYRLLASDRAL